MVLEALVQSSNGHVYRLQRISADPDVGRGAYRITKLSTGANYDVLLKDRGENIVGWSCECLGFLRWDMCRHVRMALAAEKL